MVTTGETEAGSCWAAARAWAAGRRDVVTQRCARRRSAPSAPPSRDGQRAQPQPSRPGRRPPQPRPRPEWRARPGQQLHAGKVHFGGAARAKRLDAVGRQRRRSVPAWNGLLPDRRSRSPALEGRSSCLDEAEALLPSTFAAPTPVALNIFSWPVRTSRRQQCEACWRRNEAAVAQLNAVWTGGSTWSSSAVARGCSRA